MPSGCFFLAPWFDLDFAAQLGTGEFAGPWWVSGVPARHDEREKCLEKVQQRNVIDTWGKKPGNGENPLAFLEVSLNTEIGFQISQHFGKL